MKIDINKEDFLKELILSSKFTSSKLTSSTSLQGVYLKGEEKKIHFYSTNLNFYYHGSINVKDTVEFKVVIEPKKISEFISLLPPGKIDIEVKEKSIIFLQGKTKGEFPLFSTTDFPFPPKITSEKRKLRTSFLKEALPLLFFSASTDETRPVLTGVNFVANDGSTQVVTTDGFRLSLLNLKNEIPLSSIIVPAGFLSEVNRLIDKEEEVSFSFQEEEKLLVFYLNGRELFTRLIEGEYPPYEKVIPGEKKTTIVLNKEDFLRNVKLVSVFARDFSNIIILEANKEGLKLSPKTGQGEDNSAFQEAEITGDSQKIAFNYKFLVDFLTNISSKKIIIELLRSDSPAVFKGEKNDNFLHIIMPVRIQE
ncbi:DNA polymerase III subunit beta [Candidatus Roizmanbacteria bacterium]|nr:DNA polymerase III subunit beta [Candidatus Roizmanbacteria bacterium]